MSISDQSPADLARSGYTATEIAELLGLPVADVLRDIKDVPLGPAHVARLEQAAYDEALLGKTWKETATRDGIQRLESERRPNPAVLSQLLKAHAPERYGQDTAPPVRVIVNMMGALPDPIATLEDVTPR